MYYIIINGFQLYRISEELYLCVYVQIYTIDLLFCNQNIFIYKTEYENYFIETSLDANNS